MNIELLTENPEYVEYICTWIYNEFVTTSNPSYPYEKLVEFFRNLNSSNQYVTIDYKY